MVFQLAGQLGAPTERTVLRDGEEVELEWRPRGEGVEAYGLAEIGSDQALDEL